MQQLTVKEPSNRSKKIFADAVAIQTRLAELGFSSVIAGGFARDLFFGLEPKDCDIIIYGSNADEFPGQLTVGKFEPNPNDDGIFGVPGLVKVSEALRTSEEIFQGGVWMDMYGTIKAGVEISDRVIGVYQLAHKHIDVIVYEDCESALEVVDNFDFNINQFAMYQDHEKGQTYPLYFGESSLQELTQVRADASDTRILKVHNKYLALKPLIDKLVAEGALS